jgi:hypothetical protein
MDTYTFILALIALILSIYQEYRFKKEVVPIIEENGFGIIEKKKKK